MCGLPCSGRVAMVWLVPAVATARLRLPEPQAVEHCFPRYLEIFVAVLGLSNQEFGGSTFAAHLLSTS